MAAPRRVAARYEGESSSSESLGPGLGVEGSGFLVPAAMVPAIFLGGLNEHTLDAAMTIPASDHASIRPVFRVSGL